MNANRPYRAVQARLSRSAAPPPATKPPRNHWIVGASVVLLLLSLLLTFALAASAPPDPPPSAAWGRAFFHTQGCLECHGSGGRPLAHLALTDAEIAATIRQGRAGGMPSHADLSDMQIRSLVLYLRTLP